MALDDFWELCYTYVLGGDGDESAAKERYISIYIALWFNMGKSMWKTHYNYFDEHI